MFQGSKKTMKWVSLLKDIKEKVGLSQTPALSPVSGPSPSPLSSNEIVRSTRQDLFAGSPSRDKHELELDFKRFWEEFCSSNSEKEKEAALNLTVDAFCRLVKQHANVAQLVTIAFVTDIYVNNLTGEIVTAAGVLLAIWSINGDGLAVINASQLPSDSIISITSCTFSDWRDTNWYVTGHQSGAVKVWKMVHCSKEGSARSKPVNSGAAGLAFGLKVLEYRLVLQRILKFHKHPVTALHITNDLKQLLSGDSGGHLISWTLPDESFI